MSRGELWNHSKSRQRLEVINPSLGRLEQKSEMFIQDTANLLASQTDGKGSRRQDFKQWTKGEEREETSCW